jgi:arylsulfatase A-like enzyme
MPNQLSRRNFLSGSIMAACAPRIARAAEGRRNLIWIIADQHSGLALGSSGHPFVRTPRLDGLAKQGVTFTHAFTAGLICAPSRASLDTALHVHTHGVRNNGIALRRDVPSIYSVLRENGYDAPSEHPHADIAAYRSHVAALGYDDVTNPIIGSAKGASLIPTPYRFEVGRAGLKEEDCLDAFSVDTAVKFLDRHRSDNFVLWVQLHGGHDPYVVPAPFDTMYPAAGLPMPPFRRGEFDRKPPRQKRGWQDQRTDQLSDEQIRTILGHYYGMLSQTDALVGKLIDHVAQLGLDRNTVMVYTADHGDTSGYHRMFTKGFALYEPAMRIPLIMRAPGLPAGVRVSSLASGIDVMPTVLEAMGLRTPSGIHGRSLVPLWKGGSQPIHAEIFSGGNFEGLDRLVMLRTPEWKLTRYDEGGGELYNLADDPSELDNLIGNPKYSAVVQRLTRRLEEWDHDYPHVRPQAVPGWDQRDPERAGRVAAAFANWSKGREDSLLRQ